MFDEYADPRTPSDRNDNASAAPHSCAGEICSSSPDCFSLQSPAGQAFGEPRSGDRVAGEARLVTVTQEREQNDFSPSKAPLLSSSSPLPKNASSHKGEDALSPNSTTHPPKYEMAIKWERQRVARKLLKGKAASEDAARYRVSSCCRAPAQDSEVYAAMRMDESVTIGGYMTCGSRWICPVCAEKLAIGDREALEQLTSGWGRDGKTGVFVTFTQPSKPGEPLADLIRSLRAARHKASQSGRWRYLRRALKVGGVVQRLEITRGPRSWHVHLHELWLVDQSDADVASWDDSSESWRKRPKANPETPSRTFRKAVHQDLSTAWRDAVFKVTGREVHKRFGCDVQPVTGEEMTRAAAYVAKDGGAAKKNWGVQEEMTLEIFKKGRSVEEEGEISKSRTYWQLLDDAGAGCRQSCALVHEYAAATHSVTSLRMPRSLLEHYEVAHSDEVDGEETVFQDDESVSDEDPNPVVMTIQFPRDHWSAFCRASDLSPIGRLQHAMRVANAENCSQFPLFEALERLGWRRDDEMSLSREVWYYEKMPEGGKRFLRS